MSKIKKDYRLRPENTTVKRKETGRKLPGELSTGLFFLTDAFVLFIRAMETESVLKDSTIGKYRVMLGQVVEYELHKGAKILLTQVNKDFYYDLADYLIKEENNVNKNILRKIKTIRTVMSHGLDELKIVHHIYFKQKIKYKDIEDPNKVPLEEDERQAFWNFQTADAYERMICDAFLVDMYLDLHYAI